MSVPKKSGGLQTKGVALIDDDAAVCDSSRAVLEVDGIPVQTYQSGSEFLKHLPNVACLIVDYQMPGVNGLDVVVEARKRGLDVPVVMITATTDPTVQRQAAAMGIGQFLRKPVAPQLLLSAVRQVTG